MNTATQHLVKCGIRPSVQRVAIMNYLINHITHPTVDTIFNDLRPEIPTLSRTTVYNTLQLLVEHKAVNALTIDNHTVHYDAITSPHAHFMCCKCGKIIDLKLTHEQERPSELGPDFKINSMHLDYIGVCDECSRAAREK